MQQSQKVLWIVIMNGVDLSDQYLYYNPTIRKTEFDKGNKIYLLFATIC